MDPIHPIAPGPPPLGRAARPPVERLERVSRERDRPSAGRREQQRRREPRRRSRSGCAARTTASSPHVDVRV